jgi:hypothetical protein
MARSVTVSERLNHIYVEYLVKRLTSHREAGKSFGQVRKGKLHSGGTRKILENELGGLPKDLPMEDFGRLVEVLKAKIDKTILGNAEHSARVRQLPFI